MDRDRLVAAVVGGVLVTAGYWLAFAREAHVGAAVAVLSGGVVAGASTLSASDGAATAAFAGALAFPLSTLGYVAWLLVQGGSSMAVVGALIVFGWLTIGFALTAASLALIGAGVGAVRGSLA